MNLDPSKFEYERVTVTMWPDGSKIEQDRYRADPQAPWTRGNFEVYCGTCEGQVQEHRFEQDAKILHLEHALMHIQEELMRLAVSFGGKHAP